MKKGILISIMFIFSFISYAQDDISGLEKELQKLAQNGFLNGYKISNDHQVFSIMVIPKDWNALNKEQKEKLTSGLFDVYAHFCSKSFCIKSTLFIFYGNSDGSIKDVLYVGLAMINQTTKKVYIQITK